MALRALQNGILFQFLDEVGTTTFNNKTDSGIIYKSFDHDTKTPRWAKVVSVGDMVKYIKVDDEILIAPLRWTDGIEYDGQKYWKTIEEEVLLVRNI